MLHLRLKRIPLTTVLRLSATSLCAALVSACSGPDTASALSARAAAHPDDDPAAMRRPGDASGSTGPAIGGNRATLLLDGPETYDAMFDAMASATDHINLETFILADDAVGQRLLNTLADRVRNGVVVNLIYDSVGSLSTDSAYFDRMREKGINVVAFRPLTETKPWDLHNRNHRKILVVDGKVGFAGGLNFADEYRFAPDATRGEARFGEGWRDTHVRIEGPAVAAMQRSFMAIWRDCAGENIAEAAYFPELRPVGNQSVIVAASIGDAESSHIVRHYIDAIHRAKRRVWLTQAYFVPDDGIVDALRGAAQRGVDVRIILPAESDVDITVPAARSYYDTLLESGVRIFEYASTVLHAKTAVIDNYWSTVGSSNLDTMSIEFNNELNVIVLDKRFAADMMKSFRKDLRQSTEISPHRWANRGIWPRVKEAGARLLRPLL